MVLCVYKPNINTNDYNNRRQKIKQRNTRRN